jgi:hypothetical protein
VEVIVSRSFLIGAEGKGSSSLEGPFVVANLFLNLDVIQTVDAAPFWVTYSNLPITTEPATLEAPASTIGSCGRLWRSRADDFVTAPLSFYR